MSAAVTATFLFTDLVDSTALGQRLGADGAESLRQTHFGLLRSAIEAAGGVEVKNLGDGLMVAFTSPSRALSCAVGMQQAVEHYNRRAPDPLGVRIGVSAGEAVEEDGDYFGDPVVEAARLCAAASGGQVLAADIVRVLVGRNASQELRPVGELELKGLSEPVAAVEVLWEPDATGGSVPLPARLVSAATDGLFGFFGREAELEVVVGALKDSDASSAVRIVMVGGEAGIGKSTLVSRAAQMTHAARTTVLYGHCDEDLSVPYQPWIEAIQHLVAHQPEVLDDLPAPARVAIGRLAPALGSTGDASVDADSERLALMDGVGQVFARAATEAPLLVVLDDLHWADRASLQLLRRFANAGPAAAVTVVGTYRDTDLSAGDALTTLLADFNREPCVTRLPLDGLADSDVVALMAAAAGHDLDEAGIGLAHALRRETAGNPFFTAEMLRHLGESGAISQNEQGRWELEGDFASLGLPSSVREVVGRRIERLGGEATRVLSLAAVIGRDFDVDLLANLATIDEDPLLDLLDDAATASVVLETDMPGRYRFTHALVQQTLYTDLSATRRQRAHLRVAEALEADPVGDDPERLSELAHHWLSATRPADAAKALHYAERAGDAALGAFAPDDAIAWYGRALDLLDRQLDPDERTRARLLVRRGAAEYVADVPEARDTLLAAGTLALRLGDDDLLVDAVLSGAGYHTIRDEDPERLRQVDAALEVVGPDEPARRARLLNAAFSFCSGADFDRRNRYAAEAIEVGRGASDDLTIVMVNELVLSSTQPAAVQFEAATTALDAADRLGAPNLQGHILRLVFNSALGVGDRGVATAVLDRLRAIAISSGLMRARWEVEAAATGDLVLSGRLEEAEAAAEAMLGTGTEMGLAEALGQYGGLLIDIRRFQGRLEEVAEFIVAAIAESPQMPVLQTALGLIHMEAGRLDEARVLVDALAADDYSALPGDQTYMLALQHWSEIAARVGHVEAARALRERLMPYADDVISPGAVVEGAAARALGLIDHLIGDHEPAAAWFEQALAMHERLEAPFWIAITQLDLADLLLDRAGDGDAERAGELRASAVATARELGFAGLERRVS
jgi:class 3 adenylate cyclase